MFTKKYKKNPECVQFFTNLSEVCRVCNLCKECRHLFDEKHVSYTFSRWKCFSLSLTWDELLKVLSMFCHVF